jgi:hopene-associated glycosyltransferase HpnB
LSVLDLLAGAVLGFWILVVLDRSRWWQGNQYLRLDADASGASAASGVGGGDASPPGSTPELWVLVPARDEASVLGATLPSLLVQHGEFARLILIDDGSEDGTGALAEDLAAREGAAQKVEVLDAPPRPPGWSGKLYALQAGLDRARELRGGELPPWILFADADIRHAPGSIAALRRQASAGAHDLVSVMVRLRTQGFWEKLLAPPFVYFFQLLYPFRRVSRPRSRVAAAAGGCVLVASSALVRAGGLEAIRGAVIDDVALARRVKACGGSLWLGLSPEMLSVRAYPRLRDFAEMVSRTAFDQLRYSFVLLGATLFGLGLLFVSPPVLGVLAYLGGEHRALAGAAAAWLLEAATLLPALRCHRVPAPFALTLPLASALYGCMTILSAWRHVSGRGVEWKGRRM